MPSANKVFRERVSDHGNNDLWTVNCFSELAPRAGLALSRAAKPRDDGERDTRKRTLDQRLSTNDSRLTTLD